ncbi:Hypothetical protein (Fragment) [Durusdinium trenchii]|uniref:ubiquitinyl hydrolase 1 n=1 Tax=Durusdinium trenchii TaxID=1381693 RepID=A0ABP0JHY9_9DINO
MASDVELLLSFLTVPYLRQPLLLRFFCRHDRVLALRHPALQAMLQAALFEPGRLIMSSNESKCPERVPATGQAEMALMGSPNGQLLLELARSPKPLLHALIDCLKLALDVATSSTSKTVDLYARVMSAVTFVYQIMKGEHRSQQKNWELGLPEPGARKEQEVLWTLQQAMIDHEKRVSEHEGQGLMTCLERWLQELWDSCQKKPHLTDENVQRMCDIHAHILLLLRGLKLVGKPNQERSPCHHVRRLLGSFSFLVARHTWNAGFLQIPEPEVMEVLQVHRRFLIEWLNSCDSTSSPDEFHEVLNIVLKQYTLGDHMTTAKKRWKRKTTWLGAMGCYALDACFDRGCVKPLPRKDVYWLEVNLQLLQVSMRGTFVEALAADIVKSPALQRVLHREGRELRTMQGSRALESETVIAYELMSCDLMTLRCVEVGPSLPEFFLPVRLVYDQYDAEDLEGGLEWVGDLFEPIRTQFFVPPNLKLREPAKFYSEASASAPVVVLSCSHPDFPGKFWNTALIADAEEQESSHHWTPHETMPKDEAEDSESDAEIGALQKSVVEFVEPSIGGPRMSHEISFSLAAEAEPDAADSEVKYKLQIVRRAPYIPKEDSAKPPPQIKDVLSFREYDPVSGQLKYAILGTIEGADTTEICLLPLLQSGVILRDLLRLAQLAKVPGLEAHAHAARASRGIGWSKLTRRGELFLPKEVLLGVLPECLVEAYNFYQDMKEEKVLRGYPLNHKHEEEPFASMDHWLLVRLVERSAAKHTQMKGVHAFVTKIMKSSCGMSSTAKKLVDLVFAEEGSAGFVVAQVISRFENLSHCLAWSDDASSASIDSVELPRLHLTFKHSHGKLISKDFKGMHLVTSVPEKVSHLMRGLPHCLPLQDQNENYHILVPFVLSHRPDIQSDPFSCELVLERENEDWQNHNTKVFLYEVHLSRTFLFTPTTTAALYLLLLKLQHRL